MGDCSRTGRCPRRSGGAGFLLALAVLVAACSPSEQPSDSSNSPSAPSSAAQGDVQTVTRSPEARQARTVTIAATGDILPHAPVLDSARAAATDAEFDFGPMFDEIEPVVSSADLALCHLETPLSADNTALTQPRALSFASPRELADALSSAGYDGCEFASNHTMDRDLSGLRETEEVLTDAGLGFAGPTGNEGRAGEPATYRARGVQVAHLAYTYTVPNVAQPNTDVPPEAPWLGRSLWPLVRADGIVRDARQAREDGADVVVLSMHWGQEYSTEPTPGQTDLADELLGSGEVDLILGTHVHVPQPCERVNDRYVLYGMGNSLSNQSPDVDSRLPPETQEGMVAVVELTVGEQGLIESDLRVQPTRVDLDGHVIEALGPREHPETTTRTLGILASRGSCEPASVSAGGLRGSD